MDGLGWDGVEKWTEDVLYLTTVHLPIVGIHLLARARSLYLPSDRELGPGDIKVGSLISLVAS